MKKLILIVLNVFSALTLSAHAVDSLFIDARGAYRQQVKDGVYDGRLEADYLNVHIWGSISDKFSYRVRQRLNVVLDANNPFRATDWACLYYKPTDRLKLYAGKTAIMIGGYEYDSAPIDVYFYSQFCSNLKQYFAFSVNAEYEFSPGQSAIFQISNSPMSDGFENRYAYNFAWTGGFTPWWKTIWSVNFVEDEYNRMMNYIALGNHMLFGGFALDLDLFHRASFQQKTFLFSDYSVIMKAIYSIGKWNLCGKIGYEMNSADNVDANGLALDTVIAPGSKYIYAGAGIEYFPLGNDRVRFHLAYYTDDMNHCHNLELGLKWKFFIVKR